MESTFKRSVAQLICVLLFMFGTSQFVFAEDIESFVGDHIQSYSSESLEGTMPNVNDSTIQAANVSNGTVNFSYNFPNGSKYDILRSDNGAAYKKLTDFPLRENFIDKYVFSGHTYYYIIVVYDANGKVLFNKGPYKAIITDSMSTSSKVTELWLDNPIGLVNNVQYKLDVSPFLKDGRTMVPLRFIGESNGAEVSWSEQEQKITISLNGNNIILWIGNSQAKINNRTMFMDVPAIKSNNRTLVPLRFVSENLKLNVEFNDVTKKITITSGAPNGTQPVSTIDRAIKDIINSKQTYTGLSMQGDDSIKYTITFTDLNPAGEFKGRIEWIGYNVTDDLVGKISGDTIFFTQVARHQNNETTPMDADVTMKIDSNNRVSGTWIDNKTGTVGTTWFEYKQSNSTPNKTTENKTPGVTYNGKFDAKGYPTGKTTIDFGDYFSFDGEVKVENNNFIAIGVINYPDNTKVIGRFVNGKPDGLNSIIYPNKKAYLVNFDYGKPVDFYVANKIPAYKADELDIYKSNDIDVVKADNIDYFQADDIDYFQADNIDYFQADNIDIYQADTIEPYKAEMIKLYQAEPVENITSIANVENYEAEVAKLNPPGAHSNIPIGGFTSPDYTNPMVQAWTSHMLKLPYLMNNNMVYSY